MKINQITKEYLSKSALILFICIVLGYGIFATRYIWNLSDFSLNLDTNTTGAVSITGIVAKTEAVELNGRTLNTTKEGTFKDSFVLLPGYNNVSIVVKDQFGHSNTKEKVIYYKPNPVSVALNTETK